MEYVTGCELADVKLVIQALAEIHAEWWNNPLVRGLSGSDIIQDFPFTYFWGIYSDAVADLLPELKLPKSFFEIGLLIRDKTQPLMDRLSEIEPLTCIHRDCHVDNILFDPEDQQEKVKILDWQGLGKGRPMYDVAYFMITSVPIQTRRQIEQAMIQQYHQSLREMGISNYGWEECWYDYRLAAVPKFYATVALDNSTPHKRAYRQADLSRLIAFCQDHDLLGLLRSF